MLDGMGATMSRIQEIMSRIQQASFAPSGPANGEKFGSVLKSKLEAANSFANQRSGRPPAVPARVLSPGSEIRLPVPAVAWPRTITPIENSNGLRGQAAPGAGNLADSSKLEPVNHLIDKYAGQFGVDPSLVRAVVQAESNFNPQATSSAGAKGLMQLMDGTAKTLGVTDSFDPEQNIRGGVKFLKSLLQGFGDVKLALAGYNAGPEAVRKYGGIPPYDETQSYVKTVMKNYESFKRR